MKYEQNNSQNGWIDKTHKRRYISSRYRDTTVTITDTGAKSYQIHEDAHVLLGQPLKQLDGI